MSVHEQRPGAELFGSYRDLTLADGSLGYPELCPLPTGAVLVSTWNGHCLEIDPGFPPSASRQPQISYGEDLAYSGSTLQSPTATSGQPMLCCAATRAVRTAIWQIGTSQLWWVQTDSAINAVAMSPGGDLLALGLGWYPLDYSAHAQAAVELRAVADPARSFARCPLPGVAVDRVQHHPSLDLWVAVTGARSQDRGHVVLLDRQSLAVLDMVEADAFGCRAVMIDENSNLLLLAYTHEVQARSLEELWRVEWRWRAPGDLFAATLDPIRNRMFLSNGQIVTPGSGEVARLAPLADCTGLAVLPGGRVAGISRGGTFRLWEGEQ